MWNWIILSVCAILMVSLGKLDRRASGGMKGFPDRLVRWGSRTSAVWFGVVAVSALSGEPPSATGAAMLICAVVLALYDVLRHLRQRARGRKGGPAAPGTPGPADRD